MRVFFVRKFHAARLFNYLIFGGLGLRVTTVASVWVSVTS